MDPVTTARIAASNIAADAEPAAPEAPPVQPPSRDQVKAIEAVFVQQQDEARAAHGFLGFWASAYLLHDLAIEHFWKSHDEEEEEREHEVDEETDG